MAKAVFQIVQRRLEAARLLAGILLPQFTLAAIFAEANSQETQRAPRVQTWSKLVSAAQEVWDNPL